MRHPHKSDRKPRDVRRHYRQARALKRCAGALCRSVPHTIIPRGSR